MVNYCRLSASDEFPGRHIFYSTRHFRASVVNSLPNRLRRFYFFDDLTTTVVKFTPPAGCRLQTILLFQWFGNVCGEFCSSRWLRAPGHLPEQPADPENGSFAAFCPVSRLSLIPHYQSSFRSIVLLKTPISKGLFSNSKKISRFSPTMMPFFA